MKQEQNELLKNLDVELYKTVKNRNEMVWKEVRCTKKFVKLYFDKNWKLTDINHAEYYRITEIILGKYSNGDTRDYTIHNELYSKGNYEGGVKQGMFYSFYKNGIIKSEFKFHQNFPVDNSFYYHKNGKIAYQMFLQNSGFQIKEYNDSLGNSLIPNGNGLWEFTYKGLNVSDEIVLSGELNNGYREGLWSLKMNDEIINQEEFKKGDFKKGFYSKNGQIIKSKQSGQSYWMILPDYITNTINLKISENIGTGAYSFLNSFSMPKLN